MLIAINRDIYSNISSYPYWGHRGRQRSECIFLVIAELEPNEELTGIIIPEFDPAAFELSRKLWRKACSLTDASGITPEELAIFCIQCTRCKNYMTTTSQASHTCPNEDQQNNHTSPELEDPFNSPHFRLEVGGEGKSAHGLTRQEFEIFFRICESCHGIATDRSYKYHRC